MTVSYDSVTVAGMDAPDLWTLDQLAEQVESVLAVGYPGAPNGRVRSVPDRRAIRWYTTTGLVDRPAAMRGRTALYARRHLLQLVAIKRRQAQGRSLAEIQAELTGATDATLQSIAQLPDSAPAGPQRPPAAPRVARFWSATPPPAAAVTAPAAPASAASAAAGTLGGTGATDDAVRGGISGHGDPADQAEPAARPLPAGAGRWAARAAVAPAVLLPGGVTLLLPAGTTYPGDDDVHAIRAAAVPLLAELTRRGLSDTDSTEGTP